MSVSWCGKIAILESEQKTCWVYTHFSWHESLVPIHRQLLHIWCRCWTNYIQLRVGKILYPTQNISILSSDFVEFSQLLSFNFWMIRLIKIPILPNYTPIQFKRDNLFPYFLLIKSSDVIFYFCTCILPHYVAHESLKFFWKNIYFENMRAGFHLR